MLLEDEHPHFDQVILYDGTAVQVLHYFEQKLCEHAKALDTCFKTQDLPDFTTHLALLRIEDGRFEILEIEILLNCRYMDGQFIESLKQEKIPLSILFPGDEI